MNLPSRGAMVAVVLISTLLARSAGAQTATDLSGTWRAQDGVTDFFVQPGGLGYTATYHGSGAHTALVGTLDGTFDGTTYQGSFHIQEGTVTADGDFLLTYKPGGAAPDTLDGVLEAANSIDHILKMFPTTLTRPNQVFVVDVTGKATIQRAGGGSPAPAAINDELHDGDVVVLADVDSSVTLVWPTGQVTLTKRDPDAAGSTTLTIVPNQGLHHDVSAFQWLLGGTVASFKSIFTPAPVDVRAGIDASNQLIRIDASTIPPRERSPLRTSIGTQPDTAGVTARVVDDPRRAQVMVSVETGRVEVVPANPSIAAFTLDAGQRVTLTKDAVSAIAPAGAGIPGDVDDNGVVNAADVTRLDGAISGAAPLSADEFARADVAKKCGAGANAPRFLRKDRKLIATYVKKLRHGKLAKVPDKCSAGRRIGDV